MESVKRYDEIDDIYYLNVHKYKEKAGANDIELIRSYRTRHCRNDLNGLCFVTDNNMNYIWTTRVNIGQHEPQLWQLNVNVDGQFLTKNRTIIIPDSFYPTGIALDNNLNIYFIDVIERKVYRIDYDKYGMHAEVLKLGLNDITYLFTVPNVNGHPSIPMGIEYYGLDKFYI